MVLPVMMLPVVVLQPLPAPQVSPAAWFRSPGDASHEQRHSRPDHRSSHRQQAERPRGRGCGRCLASLRLASTAKTCSAQSAGTCCRGKLQAARTAWRTTTLHYKTRSSTRRNTKALMDGHTTVAEGRANITEAIGHTVRAYQPAPHIVALRAPQGPPLAKRYVLIERELRMYVAEDTQPEEDDFSPLEFWARRSRASTCAATDEVEPGLPYLALIARLYHGIESTSCQAERNFSTLSTLIGSLRSSMLPFKVERRCSFDSTGSPSRRSRLSMTRSSPTKQRQLGAKKKSWKWRKGGHSRHACYPNSYESVFSLGVKYHCS